MVVIFYKLTMMKNNKLEMRIIMKEIYERNILLVDDEIDILDMMETVLKKEGFKEIIKAENGCQAIEKCRNEQPDIMVLDIMLPDVDGYEVCKEIRKFSMIPIIFLSAKSDEIDRLLSFALGGDDYITKPFSPKEVVYRIKAIFRRELYNESNDVKIIKISDLEIYEQQGIVKKAGETIKLTAMEFKLLIFLANNKNIILSKSRIIDEVWGCDFEGFDNTLMVHIRHLREKIESEPANPQYIQTVKKMGYIFVG